MLRKILSSVVAVSFLLNTVSYADVLNDKDRSNISSNTLAPESRLDPINTPTMLDIMKLTAEIIDLTVKTDPADRKRATSIELPNDLFTTTIDKVNASPGVNRDGDHIVFDFRSKVTVNNVTFIYCNIYGIPHGGTVASSRHYLCAAKKIEGGQYDYNFFADASKELDGNDAAKAVRNTELLTGLSIIISSKATKEGITRFVRQQNDTDRLIAKAIVEDRTAVRLDSGNAPYIKEVYDFLRANEFAVNVSFNRLVALGQVMEIPGLKTPHAGGIGIYLPMEKVQYKNAMTIIHEIFAKCGFSHKEAEEMMIIYGKMTDAKPEALTPSETALLERAKTVDFENRYDDILKIDFYKSGFNVDPNELTGRDRNWFVGIDSSTQSVKIMVIERLPDDTNRVIWTHTEKFDDPKYDIFGTTGGVLPHPHAPELHHTDPLMLADALDNCMAELSDEFRSNGLDMGNIRAIAGAGQQHGTVYLNTRAQAILRTGLHAAGDSLSAQIRKAAILSFPTSPIWQDGTTSEEVAAINKAGGGADSVRKTTGSPATRRFSLAQILANFKRQPSSGRSTDRILNIAGWNGALLTGRADFPIDPGDGLGTNAQMAGTDQWWTGVTDKLIPGLSNKLPPIKPSAHIVDDISSYWVNKYGFSRDTQVVNFTGDNPSGLAGMGVIKEGQVVISLGTSYTAYTFVGKEGLDKALETPIGHVFGETLKGEYMNLVCFHNGDQTLEDIREKLISEQEALARATQAGIEIPQDATGKEALTKKMRIEIFTEELEKTKAGNDGAMAVAMHKTEDVVRIPFDASRPFTRNLDMSNRPQVFRAYVEGQAYFMKWVAEQIGLSFTDIKLTGGVSNNPVVRQIFADVFGANVSVLKEGTEAVALGSAIRAMMAHLKLTPEEAIKDLTEVDSDKTVTPNAANVTKYNKHYKDFEELLGEAIYSGRIQDVKDYHAAKTGAQPETMAIGPGRINLLGEHTDYAGGQVLPIALDGVDVISAASTRTDGMIVVHSPRYGEEYKISVEALKALSPDKMKGMEVIPDESGWARYPLGVIRQMMEIPGVNMEKLNKGLTITYDGNVPLGGGLSSSAAVETAVFIAVDGILETGLDNKDASVLCQKAEHWRGNICGIMDQFASMNGVKGKAILLNCNTLESQPVDISFLETAGYAIVAVDTGLEKTKEAWEKYTQRVADLQTAVDFILKSRFPEIQAVLDIAPNLTPEKLESVKAELKSHPDGSRIYRRVQHVVDEEARVKKLAVIAAEANVLAAAVKAGDQSKLGALNAKVEEFGAVISAGHESLDELYEMSSPYLNRLVTSARAHGSVGSRFTGAGIVGCTVNIVPKAKLAGFREGVVSEYRAAFADKPTPKVIVSSAGDGARAIDMGKKKNAGGPAAGRGTGLGAGGRVIPAARQSSVPLKKETSRIGNGAKVSASAGTQAVAGVVPQEVMDFAEDMAKLGYKISQDGCAGLEDFVPDAEGGRPFSVFDLIKARVVRAFTTNNSIMRNILTAMAKAAKETGVNPIVAHINEAIERNPELGKPENKDELLRTVYNNINEVDVAAPLGAALEPIWSETAHRDGYISVEPFTDIVLSGDIGRIVSESIAKFNRIQNEIERATGSRPRNIFIKLPVTEAGLKAGEELIAQGYSVNFTLIATAEQYRAAAKAYKAGVKRFVEAAWDRIATSSGDKVIWDSVPERIAKFNEYIKENLPQSVASAFVSRDDRNVYDIINDPTLGKLIEHLEFRLKHATDDVDREYIRGQIDAFTKAASGGLPSAAKRILDVFDSLKVKDADGKDVVGVTKVGVAFTKAVMWPIFQEEFEKDKEWLEFVRQRELPKELMSQQIYLASTGVKIDGKYTTNAYYLENLVAWDTTNTIPYPVIYATVKGGKALFKPQVMIDKGVDEAKKTLYALAGVGIDLSLIKDKIIFDEGLKTFGDDDTASLKIIEDALPAALEIAGKMAAAGNVASVQAPQSAATDVSAVDTVPALPEDITETLLDLAAAEVSRQDTVVFVDQEFASLERCRELFPSFSKATFVPFSATRIEDLPKILASVDDEHPGCKKVLITVGLRMSNELSNMINSNADTFKDVIPLNIDRGLIGNPARVENKPLQKGMLTIGLLASALKGMEDYKDTKSYMVLRTLLNMIFEDDKVTVEYMDELVNPGNDLGLWQRWSYLISRIIGPVRRNVMNVFERMVSYFA